MRAQPEWNLNVTTNSSNSSTLVESGGYVQISTGGGGSYEVINAGVIEFTGAVIGNNTQFLLYGGQILLDKGVTLQAGDSFAFAGTDPSTLVVSAPANFSSGFGYAVTGFDYGDQLQFGTLTLNNDTYTYNQAQHTLNIYNKSKLVLALTNLSLAGDVSGTPQFILNNNTIQLACFLPGTMIETEIGEIAVERLRAGDPVLVFEHGARVLRPVRWIGETHVDVEQFHEDQDAYPVRIMAGAFGSGMPRRDLLVTGDHAICIDNGLVPARMLVNGRSILFDTGFKQYTVYHIEFEHHTVMLAEGLPVESYLDTGNRASFGIPGAERSSRELLSAQGAGPLMVSRDAVEPIWRALAHRADLLDFPVAAGTGGVCDPETLDSIAEDPQLGLILEDGRMLSPRWHNRTRQMFHVPKGARPCGLASRSARPCTAIGAFVDDRRRLGVAVRRIVQWNGLADTVLPASELDGIGWHGLENGYRWTNGRAALALPPAPGDDSFLEVEIASCMAFAGAA